MNRKWPGGMLAALIVLMSIPSEMAYARPKPEITVISEIMFGSSEEYAPELIYEEGEKLYRLKTWELEPVKVSPREKHVEQEVLYEGIENMESVPETRSITSKEDFSGLQVSAKYPVIKRRKVNEEWREDFTFPVVFHSYGAEIYQLGEENVPIDGEPLRLELYEDALLSEIGVTKEHYRVTSTVWNGAPYLDEDDILCRDATAFGKRKVIDYMITYGGTVTYPEIEGYRCRSVYSLKEYEQTPAEEKKIVSNRVVEAVEYDPDSAWIIRREAIVLTVSLILALLFMLLAAWLIKRAVEKREEKRDRCGL